MPMTAILTVSADGGRFEVFRVGEDMPTGRQWEAVRFERPGLAQDGGDLVWYVARTPAVAARLASGRAVFVAAELRALAPATATMTNDQVADMLADLVMVKQLSGGARVDLAGPLGALDAHRKRPTLDLSPGPAKPEAPAPPPAPDTQQTLALVEALPEGI